MKFYCKKVAGLTTADDASFPLGGHFIVQLRKKLGNNGDEPRHLLTVHGVGYKLVV